LACAIPTLVALSWVPSSNFVNQALALVGWGVWVGLSAAGFLLGQRSAHGLSAPLPLVGAWLLLIVAVAASMARGLPLSLGCSTLGFLLAAGVVLWFAQVVSRFGASEQAFKGLCAALALAAVANAVVAMIQTLAPSWADGAWLALAGQGRASGNMRQPNHLSTLLLWGLVALVGLRPGGLASDSAAKRTAWRVLAGLGAALLSFALVLTGSRTGALGLLILAVWGALDRRLPSDVRLGLIGALVAYGLMVWAWGGDLHEAYAITDLGDRLSLEGDFSSMRLGIWANTLELIRQHPWVGVGWGQFNAAWSLTPFPSRPPAFFDHAHNLPLQLAAELGVPLALLICGLLAWALWQAIRRSWGTPQRAGHEMAAPATMMVLLVALHSQLEYPLWYAYFLLPTVFVWGLCLARVDPSHSRNAMHQPHLQLGGLAAAGACLALGALFAMVDFARVVVIFDPPADAPALSQRIEAGQHSVFFSHHAHYAAATTTANPSSEMPSLQYASHYLLDARLMQAWAKAYAQRGEPDKARYIVDRLREFGDAHAGPFLAACDVPRPPGVEAPFQCQPSKQPWTYKDFRQ
jgi:O-antigen ligase